jgi:hypothetical protein
VAENRRQFDAMKKLMQPYVTAGTGALSGQQDILGLNGADKQKAAYDGVQSSPEFTTMVEQGENAMLQNASATGGLRGGNMQEALSQFRPQLLNQLIQQRYANLGGLSSMGQNAAAGVGNAGMQSANAISGLYQNNAMVQGNALLAQGAARGQFINSAGNAIGTFIGAKF